MEQFVVCFNAVAPFFLIMFFGWLAVRLKLVGDKFISGINKLVFVYFFPANIFMNMYIADLSAVFNPMLILYFLAGTMVLFLLLWIIGSRFLDRSKLATFVQAGYRSNYVVLATAIIAVLIEDAVARAALMIPFVVSTYVVLATIVFIVSGEERKTSIWRQIPKVALQIIKTPIVIGAIVGVILNLAGLSLPIILNHSVRTMSDIAAPAALIGIGGMLSMEKIRRHLSLAIIATVVKNILAPIILIVPAILLGFRGYDLAIIAMIGLAPTALVSYATAVEMGGDGDVAASCLALSNAVSMITIVLGLTTLRAWGFF
jgi:predicted permease